MTEWYYAEGQQRQGPLPVQEIRQRFQRGQLNLDTLVWREGMAQWAALRQVVDELGLQTLADASTATSSGGFDLRGDYAAIDNGSAPPARHRRTQQLALQRSSRRRRRWPRTAGGWR